VKKLVPALLCLSLFGTALSQPAPPRISRVSCKDFKTYAEAKRYYDAHYKSYYQAKPIKASVLDRDKDGLPCECLPGGPGAGKPNCK